MTDFETSKPRLRLIDTSPVTYEGSTYLLLRDPLALTEQTLLIPQPVIPILTLLDGTRTLMTLRAALAMRYGLLVTPQRIEQLLIALDNALLLDNERSRAARAEAQADFRAAEFRAPASAGQSYPEAPEELSAMLQGFIEGLNGKGHNSNGRVRGIVSPHIDYERGGPVYAQVWSQAAEAVRAADLAIIFGTDHYSEGRPFSLTRQNYATPYGVLPTDTAIVDALAQAIGEEAAFAGELHHRREHSIELAAVWMHHMRGGKPVTMVPVLTGSFDSSTQALQEVVLEVLRRAMHGRRAIVVAAGDLAHVGPAFGTPPVDPGKLILLKGADDELITAMCQGNAEGFAAAIQRVEDENNVCGVSPIYMTLRLLAPLSGSSHGYAVCPADTQRTSVVTICGVTLE